MGLKIKFIRVFDNVFIFTSFPSQFHFYKLLLIQFFTSRGIDFNERLFSLHSFRDGFDFCGWFLKKSSFHILFSQISRNHIRDYKLNLKTIIKNSTNITLSKTLKFLNLKISDFVNFYYLSDFWDDVANELDLYVYKLLWKFVKRCHPRRSNTWVYNKYWKSLSGLWKFIINDSLNGEICILKSHRRLINCNFGLPLTLNVFDLRNHRKISLLLYEKYKKDFGGLYFLIYKRQKGLCFSCNKPLGSKRLKLVDLSYFKIGNQVNLVSNLYLFHFYCNDRFN